MNVRFFLGFQLELGMKQLFFSREKGEVDFSKKLQGTEIRHVKKGEDEYIGLYLMQVEPSIGEILKAKENLWITLLDLVPKINQFRPKCTIYPEKFIGL